MILVTQSFGKESEYRRVVLAILSYYAHSSNRVAKTILFTDKPSWFEPYFIELPIEYIQLTPEKINLMRGTIDFLHRMKIALIEEAFELHQTDILYFDSDTFFVADPMSYMAQLSPQKSFMHLFEYQFESLRNMPLPAGKTFQAFVQLIEKTTFFISGKEVKLNAQMSSWNAGVMMLHQSHDRLINDVFQLTDNFFPATKNHASEQYAFSILLQTKTDLTACDAVIYHYWYNIKKRIIDEYLPSQFIALLNEPTLANRLSIVKSITKQLPSFFDQHLYSLKDNAIQAFNANHFLKGYNWSIKAIFAGAIKDTTFLKDVLYHFKRQLTR